ncbi:MAG: hypothetical protein GTN76_13115 [Candidatus Aenigmarchaeota archaeon]|nr:hypothetical protein [Candidatus Aenigmarchaeota archaeon]
MNMKTCPLFLHFAFTPRGVWEGPTFDFEILSYSNLEICREWNNIDILIIIPENSKKVVVTIENKIRS